MAYFLARSLEALRSQANARWPNRDRSSDGWIGDTSHSARKSDHNPDWDAPGARRGIVRAYDLDEDLDGNPGDNGAELAWWVDHLVRTRDPRIAYLIYEGRICSSTVAPWTWRKYTGSNAHKKHVHVSIRHTAAAENDTRPWFPTTATAPQEDDDMTPKQNDLLEEIAIALRRVNNDPTTSAELGGRVATIEDKVEAVGGAFNALADAFEAFAESFLRPQDDQTTVRKAILGLSTRGATAALEAAGLVPSPEDDPPAPTE